MTRKQNLFAIREHIKDGIEGHRKRLAAMWERGERSGWLYNKLVEQKELMEQKLDAVNEELCPWPKSS